MAENKIYWGDTHHNTFMGYIQNPPLEEVVRFASSYLDFYTGAYYTPKFRNAPVKEGFAPLPGEAHAASFNGVGLEGNKIPEKIVEEWAEVERVAALYNRPGEFVMFPGYEWQGNGRWGDHNVVYLREGNPVCMANTLKELHAFLRQREAIAIPHHIGYLTAHRAPVWQAEDEKLTPFAEIYSVHGCSETDEEWLGGLRNNSAMGPGVTGSTWQDALNLGVHVGAICSSDNWANMPAQWNQGTAACLAPDLSREALWKAFSQRRVYGVSGDRIELDFTLNGQPMGSILEFADRREIEISVRGQEAIDRIELLKNGRVIATHCHQGTWDRPRAGQSSRYKFRVECGWGSRPANMPQADRLWQNQCQLSAGRFTAWSPCWISRGQGVPKLSGATADFTMHTSQKEEHLKNYNATVLEFEARPEAEMRFNLHGLEHCCTVAEMLQRNHMLWDRDEAVERVTRVTGVTPDIPERQDVYLHLAWKAKLHRAIPESGYTARMSYVDREPLAAEAHYRVRVEQRNGQRAWSSPVWVRPRR